MHLLASEGGFQPFILESSDKTLLFASLAVALVALGASAIMAKGVIDSEDGTPEMQEIATAVQEGAMAYITRQFRTIIMIVIPLCFVVFFTSAEILKQADRDTVGVDGMVVNIAVSYGGRHELRDAVRSLLAEEAERGTTIAELAQTLDIEHIADHLYTRGQPDPDLIIRTSGEQRLSGFLMWQSAHSEFYFCEALWPDFRKVDFIRALRSYADRERRFGE